MLSGKRMNILLVAERYSPEVGAAPTRLTNMAEGLKEHGAEVDVLTALPNYPKGHIFEGYRHRLKKHDVINGVNVFRYWIYATVSRGSLNRIFNMFSFAITLWLFAFNVKRCRRYDRVIIQTPTLIVALSAMWLFKGLYGKTCLLNISDIWPSTAVDMGVMKKGDFSWRVMNRCEQYLYRHADGIMGQSQEILERVEEVEGSSPRRFLYRNLSFHRVNAEIHVRSSRLKICFAGMLGAAQDILSIVENVDFEELDVEFHIIGGGGQYDDICKWIHRHPNAPITAHGFVPKEKMAEEYNRYDVALVPLKTHIRGAFPSKVYDILPFGLPVLLCGEGEVANFVEHNKIGLVSRPGNYADLRKNIVHIRDMSASDYEQMSASCIAVNNALDFNKQMDESLKFINSFH